MSDQPKAYAPGLYGLVGGAVNVFVLDDAESGVTVIDAGLPGTTRRVLQLLQAIGRSPQDVRHILITHADLDHVGALQSLADTTGARIYASAESQACLRRRRIPPHLRFPMRVVSGLVAFFVLRASNVDQVISGGDSLDIARSLRVIATPGHTPGHLCYFWERERVLFAGDLVRYANGRLSLTSKSITYDVTAAQHSARLALALDPAVICPGHGGVCMAAETPGQVKALLASLPCH